MGRSFKTPIPAEIQHWLAQLNQKGDAILLRRAYIDLCEGDHAAAAILSQIFYFNLPPSKGRSETKLQIFKAGHLWLAKTHRDWWTECRVNEHTARKKIELLKELKIIKTRVFKFKAVPTQHIRLDFEGLLRRVALLSQVPEKRRSSDAKRIDQIANMDSSCPVETITETTCRESETKRRPPYPLGCGEAVLPGSGCQGIQVTTDGTVPATPAPGTEMPHLSRDERAGAWPTSSLPPPESQEFPKLFNRPNWVKAMMTFDARAAQAIARLCGERWTGETAQKFYGLRRSGTLANVHIHMLDTCWTKLRSKRPTLDQVLNIDVLNEFFAEVRLR